ARRGLQSGAGDLRFFFFFQAEDGIRDFHVTGVQTCALPIYDGPADTGIEGDVVTEAAVFLEAAPDRGRARPHRTDRLGDDVDHRSEERRVGKGWRSWRSTHH